ncbi:MAG: hypothetical protein M3131_04240 [Actinomycetota bacterium]|nr:hypothetical protein [Actinomycetota bacterium]
METQDQNGDISKDARDTLIEELEDAVGEEAVEQADLDVDRAIGERPHPLRTAFASSRLLIVLTGATALTVGIIASLAVGSWWLVAVAMALHSVLTAVVVGMSMTLFSQVEKPDSSVVTKLEDEGVDDPETVVNNLVEQVADEPEESRSRRAVTDDEGETRPPEEDPAEAAKRQQTATTPASEPTREAGSG